MNWKVTLDFKRGPSFEMVLPADDKDVAIDAAKREAQGFGFDAPVKKAAAVPA